MKALESEPVPLARDGAGVIRIAGTRVALDSVISSYRSGASIHDLVEGFPDLSVQDIEATIAFYLEHRQEVDEYLEARLREASAIEAQIRREFPEAYRRVPPKRETSSPSKREP